MKTYLLLFLAVLLLVPGSVFAEEHEGEEEFEMHMEMREREMEHQAREMEMRQRQMELETREMEMNIERQKREIELEHHKAELEAERHKMKAAFKHGFHKKNPDDEMGKLVFMICIIVNILLAIWVYKDIREKTSSSGVWIVIILLTGLLGALVYAVVRVGDLKRPQNS